MSAILAAFGSWGDNGGQLGGCVFRSFESAIISCVPALHAYRFCMSRLRADAGISCALSRRHSERTSFQCTHPDLGDHLLCRCALACSYCGARPRHFAWQVVYRMVVGVFGPAAGIRRAQKSAGLPLLVIVSITAAAARSGDLDQRTVFSKGLCVRTFFSEDLDFFYEFLDDVLAGNPAHRHAVLEDHPDISAEGDAELRIVSFARAVHRAAHDREMQRLLDVREPAFDLGDDLDKIIDIQPAACRAGDDRDAAFSKFKRFQNLPRRRGPLRAVRRQAKRGSCRRCLREAECPGRSPI